MAYGDSLSPVASDAFTSIGGDWEQGPGNFNPMSVTGGDAHPTSGGSQSAIRRITETFADDQYSQAISGGQTQGLSGVVVRMAAAGNACYIGTSRQFDSNWTLMEYNTSGPPTGFSLIASNATNWALLADGDMIRMEAEGTELRFGSDRTGTDFERINTTDATLTTGDVGIYGLGAVGTNNRFDSWEGGDISAEAGGVEIAVPAGALTIVADAPSAEIAHNRSVPVVAILISSDVATRIVNHIRGPPVAGLALESVAPSVALSAAIPSGSLTLAGVSPSAELTHNRSVPVGALVLAGVAPALLVGSNVAPATASVTFTGIAPTAEITHNRAVPVGSLALTGQAPTQDTTVGPDVGSAILTGVAGSAEITHNRATGSGSLAFTGNAPTVVITGPGIEPATAALSFNTFAPVIGVSVSPAVGSLELTGAAPQRAYGLVLEGQLPTIAISGSQAVAPGTVALTFTGLAPSAEIDHFRSTGAGSITLATAAPVVLVSLSVAPTTGAVALTGAAPALGAGIAVATGALALASDAPTLGALAFIAIPVGGLSFTGFAPSLAIANSGVSITNETAVEIPSNYEQCDYTGFRVLPGELVETGYGQWVRPESYEPKHPQEFVRSVPERIKRGQQRPEQPDVFVDTVTADDL
jgi:hypothetical protein